MRLSAVDSIQHGLLNLRANWQLVPILLLQSLAVTLLSLLGCVPIVMVLGLAFLRGVASQFDSFDPERLAMRLLEAGPPLIFAFLVATLVWTVAFVAYCYFQGGILGTLAAGERLGGADGANWQRYRAFSRKLFFEAAERLTWPIFWLLNLFLAVVLAVLVAFSVLAVAAGFAVAEGPAAVPIALGCFALLGFTLFAVALSVWMQVALAHLAVGRRGVLAASRAALSTLFGRLPAVLLLFLLMVVVSIGASLVFTPFSMVLERALDGHLTAYFSGQAVIVLAQWLASSILGVAWSAVLIALIAGEKEAVG